MQGKHAVQAPSCETSTDVLGLPSDLRHLCDANLNLCLSMAVDAQSEMGSPLPESICHRNLTRSDRQLL